MGARNRRRRQLQHRRNGGDCGLPFRKCVCFSARLKSSQSVGVWVARDRHHHTVGARARRGLSMTNEAVAELQRLTAGRSTAGYRASFVYCVHGRRIHSGIYPPVTVLYGATRPPTFKTVTRSASLSTAAWMSCARRCCTTIENRCVTGSIHRLAMPISKQRS